MRRLSWRWSALALACLLAGCAPVISLNPLFDESKKESIFFESLVGEWKVQPRSNSSQSDAQGRWIFRRTEDGKGYDVSSFEIDKEGSFRSIVHVLKLGDFLFIDVGPTEQDSDKTPNVPYPMVTGHAIGRIWVERDSLRIQLLDEAWVSKQVKAGTFELAHADVEERTILTATTEQLRKFALEHAEDKDAFSVNYDLTKVK